MVFPGVVTHYKDQGSGVDPKSVIIDTGESSYGDDPYAESNSTFQ